jgi:hypothetical protein
LLSSGFSAGFEAGKKIDATLSAASRAHLIQLKWKTARPAAERRGMRGGCGKSAPSSARSALR